MWLLKDNINSVINPITTIINQSFSSGVFPRAVIDAFETILAKNEIGKRSEQSSRGLRPGVQGVRLMAPGGSQRASAHLASQERPFHGGKMTVKRLC